jgi:hypothetical protein
VALIRDGRLFIRRRLRRKFHQHRDDVSACVCSNTAHLLCGDLCVDTLEPILAAMADYVSDAKNVSSAVPKMLLRLRLERMEGVIYVSDVKR